MRLPIRTIRGFLALACLLGLFAMHFTPLQAMAAPEDLPALENPLALLVRNQVLEASALVEEQGEAIFDRFRVEGSKWRQGDYYIFIITMDGWEVVNPPFPKMEGKNLIDMVDAQFKPFIRWMIQAASGPMGQGWTHFQWPKPGEKEPSWMTSFIKRATAPSGISYIVGSGAYNMQMEKAFIIDQVRDAAQIFISQGETAFDIIRDKSSEFLFRDTYIFITDEFGNEIVNPAFPIMEGKNLSQIQDVDGKFMVQEYIHKAREEGEGWVTHRWLKPGTNEPAEKDTFVKGVLLGDKYYVIGSGIYKR